MAGGKTRVVGRYQGLGVEDWWFFLYQLKMRIAMIQNEIGEGSSRVLNTFLRTVILGDRHAEIKDSRNV